MLYAHAHRRHRRGLLKTITLLALAAILLSACGKRGHHKPKTNAEIRERAEDKLDDALDNLDATDKQRAEMTVILDQALPTVFAMRDTRRTYGESLMTEMMQPKPDVKVVTGLVNDFSAEATAQVHTLTDSVIAAHAVLNAEQRQQIGQRWDEKASNRREGPPAWVIDAVVKRGLDEIDATDAQFEFALAKKDEFTGRAQKLRDDGKQSKELMRAQVTAKQVDRKAVHAEIDRMSVKLTNLGRDVAAAAAEFAGTLTDEQRQVIAEELMKR